MTEKSVDQRASTSSGVLAMELISWYPMDVVVGATTNPTILMSLDLTLFASITVAARSSDSPSVMMTTDCVGIVDD